MTELNNLYPEIILLSGACVVLLLDVLVGKLKTISLNLVVSIITLVLVMFANWHMLGLELSIWGDQFIVSKYTVVLKLFSALLLLLAFIYSYSSLKKENIENSEYYSNALFSLLGAFVLISAGSTLTMYLGLELLALPLYALVAYGGSSEINIEAAIKYFVTSALSSGIFLFGVSILYAYAGTFSIKTIGYSISEAHNISVGIGIIFVLVGLFFKFGLVPFHVWLPDVYQGAKTPITMMIATMPKLAALAMACNITFIMLSFKGEFLQPIFTLVALLSIAIGNLSALLQVNIKRLIGYSAISHMGFVILLLTTMDKEVISYALFYSIVYSLLVMGLFSILLLLGSDKEIENINQLNGLARSKPIYATMLLTYILGLAAIPPFAGFYPKLLIFKLLLVKESYIIIITALLFSIIGLAYYLKIIKEMFFVSSDNNFEINSDKTIKIIIFFQYIFILYLGLFPNEFYSYLI